MKTLFKFFFILCIIGVALFILFSKPIRLGLDLQGGSRLVLEALDTPSLKVDNDAVDGVLEVIRNRVDRLGVSGPMIRRKGFKQIVVELPGVKDPVRAMKLIGQTAFLEFVVAEWLPGDVSHLNESQLSILLGKEGRLSRVVDYDQSGRVTSERSIVLKKTVLTGGDLKNANPATDQYGRPVVDIAFTAEGGKTFYDVTSKHVGRPLAILLDDVVISAPNISEAISGGRAQISGQFSAQEMKDLVIKLKAGALPVPVEVLSNKIVGPTLGLDAIEKSKEAFIVGMLLVCLYMVFMYRIPGFLSIIALGIYLIISLACLKLFEATLTLAGIAGFILTIGMAVDANVIIFERIKEERSRGLNLLLSVSTGFKRAFKAILDANLTTLFAAFVLFWLGTGSIKGFAVTLSIGILMSMFSAIVVTQLLIDLLASYFSRKKIYIFK